VHVFTEVAVAGATGAAGAAGVDVLRVDGCRGLLNGKCIFNCFFGSGSSYSKIVNAGGQKKIHRHFTLLISHPLSLCRFFLTCGYLEFWPFFSAFFT